MFMMVYYKWQRLSLKKIRCLMCTGFVLTVLYLSWIFRHIETFQLFVDYLQTIEVQKYVPGNTVLQGQSASLVAVAGTSTLLVSAYLEHRTKKKEVRVIAIVLRRETAAYRCHLRCQEQLHVSVGVNFIHRDHFGFQYGTASIMCPLPPGCNTPSHVAMTSAASKSEDELHHGFLEVKNQNAQTDSFPYNFTLCLSTMFDFTNVLQLVQSLEMLQILGVDKVVVYKTNCSIEVQRVLDFYTNKGLLEVIPWSLSKFLNVSRRWLPIHGPGELHYFGQIPALNDCLYRNMYRSKYVALHDMDELILPKSVNSWLELLPLLTRRFRNDKCYMFWNTVFPNDVVLPPPAHETPPPQGCWANVTGVNIIEHLYKEPVHETKSNVKIIVNPRSVFTVSVHGVLDPKNACVWVPRNIAQMYHTRPKVKLNLKAHQLIYDGRLLNFIVHLIPAVNAALRENGLLPADGTC